MLVGLRYVTTDNGALSVLMQKMKHGVRRMLKLPVGPLDTVELSTQYYTTRKIMSPVLVYTMSYYSKHNTYTYITSRKITRFCILNIYSLVSKLLFSSL